MGFFALLIGIVVLILIFVFTFLSNSPSTLTPEKSQEIQSQALDAVNLEQQKNKIEQDLIKNIDRP